ncbi:MAG: cytochrome c oxidase subunit II [Balneolales bacterium]
METFSEIFLPQRGSTGAADVDTLFHFIHITGFILLAGITIAIIYFCIKYRRKSDDEVTPIITHNANLEITWSVIPLILILIVFSWGFRAYLTLYTPPSDAFEINVTARSWSWEFIYPEGGSSIGELYVPANRPVKLIMRSEDVIHSFAVPDYRVKMDVIPNRYTTLWFEANEPGTSQVFCTEYCGTGHSAMLAEVIALDEEEWEEWLETGLEVDEDMPLAELGEQTYTGASCNACHSVDGTPATGPTFQGLYGTEREFEDGTTATADENYLRESILEPQARITAGYPPVMPTLAGSLSEREIEGLIEYIKELE